MNDKDNRPDRDNDEEISDVLNTRNPYRVGYQLGFILHHNFSMHVLLTLVINLICGAVVIGFLGVILPVVEVYSIVGFVIAMILYTLMELIIKLLMIRFIWKIVIQSFGLLFFVANVSLFYVVELSVEDFTFLHEPSNIFTFTIIFMIVRLLFTSYVRKARWIQKGA